MAKTTFSGPVRCGDARWGVSNNLGNVVLEQQVVFCPTASIVAVTDADGQVENRYNGIAATAWAATAAAATASFSLPANSTIIDIIIDQSVVTTGGTAINATAGISAAGVEYMPLVDLKTAVRLRPTFVAANLIAMQNITTNTTFYFQIVPTATAVTAGIITVTVLYTQAH
jgi:hypothetical protein